MLQKKYRMNFGKIREFDSICTLVCVCLKNFTDSFPMSHAPLLVTAFSWRRSLTMWRPIFLFLSLAILPLVFAQDKKPIGDEKKLPVKKGPDGRPLLFGPKIELCKTRKWFISSCLTCKICTKTRYWVQGCIWRCVEKILFFSFFT